MLDDTMNPAEKPIALLRITGTDIIAGASGAIAVSKAEV